MRQLPAALLARPGDDVVLVVLVAGVDVDRDQREVDRRALAQVVEHLHQRPAVLAARQADHDAVAVLDQVEVDDRLGRLLGDRALRAECDTTSLQSTRGHPATRRAGVSDHGGSHRATELLISSTAVDIFVTSSPLRCSGPSYGRATAEDFGNLVLAGRIGCRVDGLAHQAAQAAPGRRCTRKVRDRPYFEWPNRRGRWLTTDLRDAAAELAGQRRQVAVHARAAGAAASRLRRGRSSASSRCRGGGCRSPAPSSQLATTDGTCRVSERVLAAAPPAADDVVRLAPASASRGMSAGSFCRSPSAVTMKRPRACGEAGGERRRLAEVPREAHHADTRIAVLHLAQRARRSPSALPSSIRMHFVRAGRSGASTRVSSSWSGTTFSSSSRSGMTTREFRHGISWHDAAGAALQPLPQPPGDAGQDDQADDAQARRCGPCVRISSSAASP